MYGWPDEYIPDGLFRRLLHDRFAVPNLRLILSGPAWSPRAARPSLDNLRLFLSLIVKVADVFVRKFWPSVLRDGQEVSIPEFRFFSRALEFIIYCVCNYFNG